MPSPSFIQILGDLLVTAYMKPIPLDWCQPRDDTSGTPGARYADAFAANELAAMPDPMCYFKTASVNKYHVDAAKQVGSDMKDFVKNALDQVKTAIDMWRVQVKPKSSIKIMACCGLGAPGAFDCPGLKDSFAAWTDTDPWSTAVKDGVSKSWDAWASKITVPGLPLYPAFVVYPGPMAPPTPGIPLPLVTYVSPGLADMTPMKLKQNMIDAFKGEAKDNDKNKVHEVIFEALGVVISLGWMLWTLSQQVNLANGKGPVPIYAPPYVPMGPVVAGDLLPTPILAT